MPRVHISSGSRFEEEIGYSRAVVEGRDIATTGKTLPAFADMWESMVGGPDTGSRG